jgi:hypothetical protein
MPFPRNLLRIEAKFFSAHVRTRRSVVGIPASRMAAICCGVSHTSLIEALVRSDGIDAVQRPDIDLDVAV